MKPTVDGWSVVLAGAWNPAIFTPAWVVGRLTQAKDVAVEFSIDNPGLSPRLNFDGLYLRLVDRRLILNPRSPEDAALERIQAVACKILTELPHTPMSAVGVNFQFSETDPASTTFAKFFTMVDAGSLADRKIRVHATSVRRSLEVEEGIVNLTIAFQENDQVVVDFNFHQEVADAKSAVSHLDKGVRRFKDRAMAILREVYNIESVG